MIAQEDTLFYYEVDQKYPTVVKTDLICYFYRLRSTSIMHSKSFEKNKRYYLSMKIMIDTYMEYLLKGTYREKDVLMQKLHHMKENLVWCLLMCHDEKFVKDSLKELKELGYYPYPFRIEVLKGESHFVGLAKFVLPIKSMFIFEHWCYLRYVKYRYGLSN